MNSDLEGLLAAAAYEERENSTGNVVERMLTGLANSEEGVSAADVAAQLKALIDNSATSDGPTAVPPTKAQTPKNDADGLGETVARTAAKMTGVGPLITGLLSLFGSESPEPLPALEKYELPLPVSVEAALTGNRDYSALRYGQGGIPESVRGGTPASGQVPSIQVNIQAMDSQSFLDRQDDIARAVREAMLHSNSINDVVLEL